MNIKQRSSPNKFMKYLKTVLPVLICVLTTGAALANAPEQHKVGTPHHYHIHNHHHRVSHHQRNRH
jgi:hypothetical protein